ncbi:MAG TPA: hypothetical protein VNC22_01350 [Sporichthya sp.]|nr:hypothetical protein [Sporichthya sp.]
MTDFTVIEIRDTLTIDITEASGTVVTVEATPTVHVDVASTGLQGPAGPQGPTGPAGGDVFIYDRGGVPASQWVIDHNLGRLAHVTVVLDTGEEITTDVDQHNPNTCTIVFAQPTSGKALVG